jgi:hypothetical protein
MCEEELTLCRTLSRSTTVEVIENKYYEHGQRCGKRKRMTWQEELRAAQTEEDFECVKKHIVDEDTFFVITNITSPIVLRASLLHFKTLEKKEVLTLFYWAARSFRVDLLEVFFPDFLVFPNLRSTLLREREYYSYLEKVIIGGYVDVIAFFLQKGMNVNIVSPYDGKPILSTACCRSKIDIIDLLLIHGADVNMEDKYGYTPASYAMFSKDVRVLDRLIMHGADLYHRNKKGNNLWSTNAWQRYRVELEPNFQRLADMRVPLDVETYNSVLARVKVYPIIQGVVDIMQEVLKEQGMDVEVGEEEE